MIIREARRVWNGGSNEAGKRRAARHDPNALRLSYCTVYVRSADDQGGSGGGSWE